MGIVSLRWVLLGTLLTVALQLPVHAQDSPIRRFQVHITEPAYTGFPIWIEADSPPQEVRYPYHEDPSDMGPNRLEVRRGNQILAPLPFKPWFGGGGLIDGSIAPQDSPRNRLPLHLQYALNVAGAYSVRWTEVRQNVVVAQSDWTTFNLKQSKSEQRKAWLQKQLIAVPSNTGLLVGDFLPSLLAAAPDFRVLQAVLEQLYSTHEVVRSCALASLRLFPEKDIRTQVVELLHRQGPSEAIAYLLSWRASWFQDRQEDLVLAVLPYLHSRLDWQVAAALKTLVFLVHPGNFHWPTNSAIPAKSDEEVLAVAPQLSARGTELSQPLAEYLGGIKSDAARELLMGMAESSEEGHEQAMIALTWIGDSRDLVQLGDLLLKPGDPDKYGRDRASLPYSLVRGYGDRAIPYLEKSISESPYVFVRTQSAEQLALKGQPLAFRFFLDAVETNQFYKPELINWLKSQFPNELPRSADDAAVIAFLESRLKQ
jgi:hypothetical protein